MVQAALDDSFLKLVRTVPIRVYSCPLVVKIGITKTTNEH